MDINKPIYHYTSIRAFVNILKSKELWLSNIATMNDKKEITAMLELLKSDLEKSGVDTERTKELLYCLESEYKQLVYLAACFSLNEDDAAMWERYADDARGVCVKINPQKLNEQIDKNEYILDYVKYSQDENYQYILDTTKDIIQTTSKNDWFYKVRGSLLLFIKRSAILYKNKSFESEREVRLCRRQAYSTSSIDNYVDINGVIKFVDKMPFEPCNVISEIILGPRANQNIDILKGYVREIASPYLANTIRNTNCSLR